MTCSTRAIEESLLTGLSTCSDMLNEGDRRLDDKFVELERQQLERSLKATPSSSPPPDPVAVPEAPAAASGVEPVKRGSPGGETGSAGGLKEGKGEQDKAVVAEWWTMGQNALMEGALKNLAADSKPAYPGALRRSLWLCFQCPSLQILVGESKPVYPGCVSWCAPALLGIRDLLGLSVSLSVHCPSLEHLAADSKPAYPGVLPLSLWQWLALTALF